MSIRVGKGLTCGCCGEWFRTWEGYEDQDQDAGYGICKPCQASIKEHDEREWDKAIKTLADGLNPSNQMKFLQYDRDTQKAFVLKALDEGILTFQIKPRVGGSQ